MTENYCEFSIIIPSRNRCDTLAQVLRALEAQTFPKSRFEVIVINDASTDNTMVLLTDYIKNAALNLMVLQGSAATAGAARNLGLLHARGRRIVFLDADTIPQKELLVQHMIWHDHFGDFSCICGYVAMSEKLDKTGQGRTNDTTTKYDRHQIFEMVWEDYRTANTSISGDLCRRVGGFDPDLPAAEDTEFASRLQKLGARFLFVRDIEVIHHHPMNYDGFLQKGEMYGRAVAHWYGKAPELRTMLTSRYGVYAPELAMKRKVKHLIRHLFVNSLTVPMLSTIGRVCRSIWFEFSEQLYKCVFRYHVRRSFRTSLKNI
jgi:glycosyltransferase involved in cell wall biosynthesis